MVRFFWIKFNLKITESEHIYTYKLYTLSQWMFERNVQTDGRTHTHRYRLYKRMFERTSLAVICIYLKVIRLCLNMRWLPADWLYNSRTDGRTDRVSVRTFVLRYFILLNSCTGFIVDVHYEDVLWYMRIRTYCGSKLKQHFIIRVTHYLVSYLKTFFNMFSNLYKGILMFRYCSPT